MPRGSRRRCARVYGRRLPLGLRQLRRRPGFALVVVSSLALGIGANTAIFSLIDAALLRMLSIDDPAGLQLVVPRQANGDSRRIDYPEFRRLRDAEPGVRRRGGLRHDSPQRQRGRSTETTEEGHSCPEATFRSLVFTPSPDGPLDLTTT